MRDATTFVRGTSNAVVATFREFPDNEFWNQAQKVLGRFLTSTDYGPDIYVPVEVAPGKTVAEDIHDFLLVEDPIGWFLLVGQYGIGKSAALKHLYHEFILPCQEDEEPWLWIYFDANSHHSEIADSASQLTTEVAGTVAAVVDGYLQRHSLSSSYFLEDMFRNDRAFALLRQLFDSTEFTPKLKERVSQMLDQSHALYLGAALRFLTRRTRPNRVVLVLDNFDSQAMAVQLSAVRLAADQTANCGLKAIVPVRRSTEAELRHSHRDVFGPFVQTSVSPPDMTEVIRRRLEQAMLSPEAQEVTLGEGALRARVQESPEFVDVLVHGLSASAVKHFLNNMSNESVREALQFAMHIYSSHFIDARRIIKRISPAAQISPPLWHGSLPYHVVVKALLLRNWPIYRPDVSRVGNIFGTSTPHLAFSPFVRIYMLSVLNPYPNEVPLEQYKSILQNVLVLEPGALENEFRWLLRQDWIVPDGENVRLTQRGHFMRYELMYDVEYLTHVSTDVRMYPELCERLRMPTENMMQRMNNLLLLLEFLVKQEYDILRELSRNRFRSYLQAFGSLVITSKILWACKQSLEAINVETDEHREVAVTETLQRLSTIESSASMRGIEALINRFR